MNIIDIIILVPILFGAYRGFSKGLLMELVSLLSFVLATILAFRLMDAGIEIIAPYLGNYESILPYVSFVLIFLLVIYLVTFVGKAAKKLVDVTILGKIDDLAGAFLGAAKWAFAFSVLLWLSQSASLELPDTLTGDSVVYPYFVQYGPIIIDAFSSFFPLAQDLIESIKEKLQIG